MQLANIMDNMHKLRGYTYLFLVSMLLIYTCSVNYFGNVSLSPDRPARARDYTSNSRSDRVRNARLEKTRLLKYLMVVSHKYKLPCLQHDQVLGEKENCIICLRDFELEQDEEKDGVDSTRSAQRQSNGNNNDWHDLKKDDYVVVLPCGLDGCSKDDEKRQSWYL